jgi:predicted Ser/Thr protein kinase
MKKIILAMVITLGVIGYAKADVNEVVSNITQAPVKLHNHILDQVEKTKQYQANSWADAKAQWLRLKTKFIKTGDSQ